MYLDMSTSHHDGALIICARGELAKETVKKFKDEVVAAAHRFQDPIIIDMEGIDYVDSKGAAVLLNLPELTSRRVFLASVPLRVTHTLQTLSVTEKIRSFTTLDIAISKLSA